MSDSTERLFIGIVIIICMGIFAFSNKSYHDNIKSQLTAYQDSVSVLIEENIKLNEAQIELSDSIVSAMGIKRLNLDTEDYDFRYDIKLSKPKALQEVKHGKD